MKDIKLTKNFWLWEFLPKEIYNGPMSDFTKLGLIDDRLPKIVQFLRDLTGQPLYINNWKTGGKLNQSGYRDFSTKTGAIRSQHKFGRAVDIHCDEKTPQEILETIRTNKKVFRELGLTVIENIADTPGWIHLGIPNTLSVEILIIKP